MPTPPLPETHAMDTVTRPLTDSLHPNSVEIAAGGSIRPRRHGGALSPGRHSGSERTAQNASILANNDECTRCRASRRGGTFPVAAGGDVSHLVHRENPAAAACHAKPRCLFGRVETTLVGRPRSRVLRVSASARAPALIVARSDRGSAAGDIERPWSTGPGRRAGAAPDVAPEHGHPCRMVDTAMVSWLGRSRRSRSHCATGAR